MHAMAVTTKSREERTLVAMVCKSSTVPRIRCGAQALKAQSAYATIHQCRRRNVLWTNSNFSAILTEFIAPRRAADLLRCLSI